VARNRTQLKNLVYKMAKRSREWSLDELEGWEATKVVKVPKSTWVQPEAISGQETCPICMDDLDGSKEELTLQCRHKFHKVCLGNWFKAKQECPSCRASVSKAIVDYCEIKKPPASLLSPADEWHFDAEMKRGKVTYRKHYTVPKLTDAEIGVLKIDFQRSTLTEKKLLMLQANLAMMPQARRNKWQGLLGRVITALLAHGVVLKIF
jgi:hypothetical protein